MSNNEGFAALTYEQQKQMLEFFMYRLGGEKCDLREELAASLPIAYNAWCGRDIVCVVSADDPQRRWYRQPGTRNADGQHPDKAGERL